jgi:hypothetical protein
MPRYYFDVAGMPDNEGIEFDNDDEAKNCAIEVTRELAQDAADGSLKDVELVVRDDMGERFRFKVMVD